MSMGLKIFSKSLHDLSIKVVYASSSSVYGDTPTIPISEKISKKILSIRMV